nr:glycosyltransferase [Prevotella sp.]
MQNNRNNSQGISPLISFIITTYELPFEYLKVCIQSVLRLSLSEVEREIIVIDDGTKVSQINEIIKLCPDIIYLWQANQGLSMARNAGIHNATGKYIQFVDGDDYLIQVPYEHCLDIVRYHNPDVVIFDATQSNITETPFSFTGPETGSSYMFNYNLHARAWGYIFRKAILMNLRFTPGIFHEDEEFTPLLYLRAEKLYFTSSKAYFYRKRQHSITQENKVQQRLQRLTDIEHIIFHLQDISEKLPRNARVALKRRIAQLSMDYLYNTIVLTKSEKHLNKAIRHLHSRNLFPLPDKEYTRKYTVFRKVINSNVGRKLMLITLPQL